MFYKYAYFLSKTFYDFYCNDASYLFKNVTSLIYFCLSSYVEIFIIYLIKASVVISEICNKCDLLEYVKFMGICKDLYTKTCKKCSCLQFLNHIKILNISYCIKYFTFISRSQLYIM